MPRLPSRIDPRLNKRLAAYAAAATTTIGAGTFSAVQPAEAEVVYRNTHIEMHTTTPIDLNRDGITDFTFGVAEEGSYGSVMFVAVPAGNAFVGAGINAIPLSFGVPITPKDNFGGSSAMLARFSFRSGSFSGGPWAGKINQYMGVKFLINGKQHFGWIRITVEHFQGHISGVAYETVPNKPIKAGYTSGGQTETAEVLPLEQLTDHRAGATLGMLGRGADALGLWRRKETTIAS